MGSYGRQWELAVTLWKILGFSIFCASQRKRESNESIAYKASLKWNWINALNRGGSRAWDVPARFRLRWRIEPEKKRQMTCKPGSVRGLAAPGWPFLWDGRCRPPHATYPRIWRGSRLARIAPFRDQPGPILLCSLAPGGVYRAASVAGRAVRSYRTVSPLPTIGTNPRGRRSILCGTFPELALAGR